MQRRMDVPIWNDNHASRQGNSCNLIYSSEPTISRMVLPIVLINPVTKALPAMK